MPSQGRLLIGSGNGIDVLLSTWITPAPLRIEQTSLANPVSKKALAEEVKVA
jgi:hypothetical protein